MANILLILSYYAENYNDPGNFTRDLAEGIDKHGNNVTILAPHKLGTKFYEEMDKIKVYRFPYFFPLKYQKLAYDSGLAYNSKKYMIAKIQMIPFILMEIIFSIYIQRKEKISIINTHWLIPQGFVGAIIKRLCNVKHVATLHSSEITLLKKNIFTRKIALFIANNSDAILSVSKHRATELFSMIPKKMVRKIKEKTKYISMGVKERKGEVSNGKICTFSNDCINILFVGRLLKVKGCEYLINGFNMALKDNHLKNKIKLHIIGFGNEKENLKKIVKDLEIENDVIFYGRIPNDVIYKYYESSDIFIMSSIVDSHGYQEGFPVVILEAMSYGLPIIATNIAGVREILIHEYNGLIVEQKNALDIYEAIIKMVNDHELLVRISSNCLKEKNKYSWNTITNKYQQIFDQLMVKL